MNIDEIKKDWNSASAISPEITKASLLAKAKSPIESVRKNVLFECVFYLVTAIVLLVLPLTIKREPLTHVTALISSFVFLINVVLFVVFTIRFYIKMKKVDFSQSSSLREFIFQSRVGMELYRAYSFTLMPVGFFVSLSWTSNNIIDHIYKAFQDGSVRPWTVILALGFFFLLLMFGYWFTNYWIRSAYGKHIDALDEIQQELN